MTPRVLFAVPLLLSGCGFTGSVVKSVVYADHGGLSPAEYDAGIQDSIETELARELRGQSPHAGAKTWTHYWRWRYSLWREHFDGEKWVTYTRSRRQQLGLKHI
jgi:hypothetical protein